MNGLDLQTALGYVDLELAEAAAAPPQRKHRPWKRLAAIAACVCLLLAGTALAGEKLFGVSILNMITGRQESSYQVLADVKQFSPEEFSSPDLESALELSLIHILSLQRRGGGRQADAAGPLYD